MRLFFASDLHGSERCFRKFLNAAAFYEADELVLGGDLTGKAILPIVDLGGDRYLARLLTDQVVEVGGDELPALTSSIRDMGLYPYIGAQAELDQIGSDKALMESVFRDLIRESLTGWVDLAAERLGPAGRHCYLIPGNDDMPVVDEVLEAAPDVIVNVARKKAIIADRYEMVGLDYVNPTPWDSHREAPEDKMALMLDAIFAQLETPDHAIVNIHCPPLKTGLDQAPRLSADLRPMVFGGHTITEPVGSQAVRDAITAHQPLLGLHGHIHESRASARLGRTVCVNPGSDYTDGLLRGAIIELADGSVTGHRFVTG